MNACVSFKVITPFQSATMTQLLTTWPCIFHVLLLTSSLPPELFNSTKKHLLAEKKKPVLQSGHIQGKLPTQIQTFASAVPGAEKKPTLAFQLTCGPPVWSVKAECASSSHPTTAVCSSLCATRLARLLAPTCD